MIAQPKALRLAAVLETQDFYHDREAADELRRLHAENEALRAERDKAASENQRWIDLANTWAQEAKTEQRLSYRMQAQQCAAQRDELLAELERIAGFTMSQFMGPHDMALECGNVARAAIAKVKGGAA